MQLQTTYVNERIQLLEGVYGSKRANELEGVSRLYNPSLGPVISLDIIRPEPLDVSVYSTHCHHVPLPSLLRDLMVKASPNASLVPGGGKGLRPLGAALGGLGEISERLLAMLDVSTLLDRLEYTTYEELERRGVQALGPDDVPLFAPEQYATSGFKYRPFRSDSYVGWVRGRDLFTDEPVFVPAQLVLLYQRLNPLETPIGYATTSGFACHPSRHRALLHGLYEVMERDALNLRWYSRLAPPRVDVDFTGVLAEHGDVRLARMSTPYMIEPKVFLLSLDMPIPILATIAFDRSRDERIFLGGSAGASACNAALVQALCELGQLQTGFRFDDPFGRAPVYADTPLSELEEFFDSPVYYGHADNVHRTYWFTASHEVLQWRDLPNVTYDDEAAEYDAIVEWLRNEEFRVIVFDFIEAAGPGVALTKVFVPQLSHACPPGNPMLGHPRFTELPQRLGLASRPLKFDDLSVDPIPFA
jgi:ribosomal protein S12 methylthiotransferase accessory factor